MSYDLHIECRGDNPNSNPTPILLAEWRDAVAATGGVRFFPAQAHTIANPKTGEVINIPAREGDAEVFFSDSGQWHSVFRWRGESAVFAGHVDPDTWHHVWVAAVALATRLGAVIRGDEGELYDLQTGKIVDA